MRGWWRHVAATLLVAAGSPARPAPPAPCADNALCYCRDDHFTCDYVPFHRFPETEVGARHVSVCGARLVSLGEAALDARRLRTLVLVAAALHHLAPHALASMVSTLASLDLGYNEFTEVPIEALRELKVLNWLNLQNNYISDIDPNMDWGFLEDSLSSLSLSNNQLQTLEEGALAGLRQLSQLELEGNRLHAVAARALPPALVLLRAGDNLLHHPPCGTRLRHLHLRNNLLHTQSTNDATCHARLDSLDLSHNELDDTFHLHLHQPLQLRQLLLDFNDFTSIPMFVADTTRLRKLSIAYNRLGYVSNTTLHALSHALEKLELDHNQLVSMPPGIREMLRLRHLSLAYNRLTAAPLLPPHLQTLSLAGNFLIHFPTGLHMLVPAMLAYLDLSYNQIEVVNVAAFGTWSDALTTLNLKGNRITQLTSNAFPAALPVRELLLSFNELYQVEAGALANLTALQVLELSSVMFSGEFPLRAQLDSLSWLTLDNNNIHHVSSDNILNFPSLEYLNLDFNKIVEFPSGSLTVNRSCKLRELRLSYNYINRINSNFFGQLTELQSLDLSYNHLHNATEHWFCGLLNLVYLNLAGNLLEVIADRAFCRLPKLELIELQENHLVEFSTEYFKNVSSEEINFSVNVSYNRIVSLVGGGSPALINILDLSHNLLESLSKGFFDSLGTCLRQIILSSNRLTHIDSSTFSALAQLQLMNLHNNNISAVKRRAFTELSALQILDLSRNRLVQLSVEQFYNMRRLRHLRLNDNLLRALPRDSFKNTILEHLDLSGNQFTIFPSSALAQVGFTLRRLELAGNHLEYLDAAMFHAIAFLHELSLARNALTVLSDNTFAGLSHLRRLDLSHNVIKTNFKELFHNVPRLRRLVLSSAGLKTMPHLPLANLTELDLSGNHIASYREGDVRRLNSLRVLVLARNKFTSLQPAMWAALTKLTSLDVSHNPIVRVSRGAFEGLNRLLQLRMDNLYHVEAIEPRAFRPLLSLRAVTLDSPTFAGRNEITLADIVACTVGLESLELHVRERVLDAQLSGVRAPKLRAVEVRGGALRQVSARALAALGSQRALALRLSGTGVRALPPALLRPLAHVPHLSLDLSDNHLVTFTLNVLYPNMTGWGRLATKLLPGGLVLSRVQCGCGVVWVGAWLRRWCAEVGGWGAAARRTARRSTCAGGAALLALRHDAPHCRARALSARATHALAPHLLLYLVMYYLLT